MACCTVSLEVSRGDEVPKVVKSVQHSMAEVNFHREGDVEDFLVEVCDLASSLYITSRASVMEFFTAMGLIVT